MCEEHLHGWLIWLFLDVCETLTWLVDFSLLQTGPCSMDLVRPSSCDGTHGELEGTACNRDTSQCRKCPLQSIDTAIKKPSFYILTTTNIDKSLCY